MDSLTLISPRFAFGQHARMPEELERRLREELRRKEFEAAQQAQLRRKADDRKRDEQLRAEEELAAYAGLVLASQSRIDDFTARLDRYDTATVEALLANEHDLTLATERLERSLAAAVQLPDGRRVFKTLDGTRVFDEHGREVSPDEIRPEEIADAKERFEPYWAKRLERQGLVDERGKLIEFHEKLDHAHDRLARKGLTDKDLNALEKDIDAAVPERVRKLVRDDPAKGPAKDANRSGEGLDPDPRPPQPQPTEPERLGLGARGSVAIGPSAP